MSTVGSYRGPNIVTRGLVLHLDAASPNSYYSPNGGTVWKDVSGNDISPSMYNQAEYNSNTPQSFALDGTNDYLQVTTTTPSLEFQYSDNFTLEAYVLCRESGTGYIINNRVADSPVSYAGWALVVAGGKFLGICGGYQSGYAWRRSESSTSDFQAHMLNKWAHAVYVNSSIEGQSRLYMNGVDRTDMSSDDSTPPATIPYNTSHKISIGISPADGTPGGHYLNGEVGAVRVYNRALTAQEVLQNFNSTKDRFGL